MVSEIDAAWKDTVEAVLLYKIDACKHVTRGIPDQTKPSNTTMMFKTSFSLHPGNSPPHPTSCSRLHLRSPTSSTVLHPPHFQRPLSACPRCGYGLQKSSLSALSVPSEL
ncbi:hypothetical protein K469DRAFT_190046 [Zopfia rhizophila CBS 207.26]|uniref:Uncharacterized protein n=1 Tax=Zopfia rhizophila CBS 207.26 TaxID=1314779 RepID=A0A6A6ETC4_9PEZI|nr:hypothetical protein K469DRAFT_190046 [Zopfia rhizophila CBS 207.26]